MIVAIQTEKDDLKLILELLGISNGLEKLKTTSKDLTDVFKRNEIDDLAFLMQQMHFMYDCLESSSKDFTDALQKTHLIKFQEHNDELQTELDIAFQVSDFISSTRSYEAVKSMRNYKSGVSKQNFALLFRDLISSGMQSSFNVEMVAKQTPSDRLLRNINSVLVKDYDVAPNKFEKGNDTIFTGRYVFLKDLVGKFDKSHSVIVIASRILYVDCNLQFHDTHLALIAPTIEVIGVNRNYIMTGSDAKYHQQPVAASGLRGIPGAAGSDGLPGFSSGSARFIAKSMLNSRQLTVRMSGGAGSDGQKGGNGFTGTDSKMTLKLHDVVDCIFQNSGEKCVRYLPEHEIDVTDYTRKDHCIATVTTSNGIAPSAGGSGGNGGAGGRPGYLMSTWENANFVFIGDFGCVGRAGEGGIGGSSCIRSQTRVKCNLYLASSCIDTCYEMWDKCDVPLNAANGVSGAAAAQSEHVYKFKEPSGRQLWEYMRSFMEELVENSKNKEQNVIDVKNLLDLSLTSNEKHNESMLAPLYTVLNSIVELKVQRVPERQLLEHLHDILIKNRQKMILKKDGIRDVIALESLILSRLELLENLDSKRVVIMVRARLETFKNKSMDLLSNWRDAYKRSVVDTHKAEVSNQIEMTKKLHTKVVNETLGNVEKKLKQQFDSMIETIGKMQAEAKNTDGKLHEQKQKVAKIIVKRIVFGSLKLLGGIAAIFNPAVGASMQLTTSVAEKIATQGDKISVTHQVHVPAAVTQVKDLLTKFDEKRFNNAAKRKEFQLSVANRIMKLDAKTDHLLKESTRHDLQQSLINTGAAETIDNLENFNEKFKNVLDTCRTELEATENPSADVTASIGVLKVAHHASVLGATVISDLRKVQHDQGVMEQLDKAIETNIRTMIQLDAFEKGLYATFQPHLKDMRKMFEQFTNETQGQAQHALIFRSMDLQKMTRQFTSFLRKFTDGFPDEQEELMGIIADLEALASAAMSAQTHVNELNYKFQLTNLIEQMTDDSGCYGTDLCALRIKVTATLRSSELLQQYAKLESAYQQAIFPFSGKGRVEYLQPGAHDNATIVALTARVTAMIDELADRDQNINAERDKDVRISEFNSKYSASAPFYTWRQAKHADQISRVLQGERVTLVADVRRTERKINAVKFEQIGINVTAPGVDLQPMLKFLELELTHGGDNHFRCGNRFYAIAADSPLVFTQSFERNELGKPVVQNTVVDKFSRTDVPFSPYTVWTVQLKAGPLILTKQKQ